MLHHPTLSCPGQDAAHGSESNAAQTVLQQLTDRAQKAFLEVQKAHEILSDPSQRRTYDAEQSRRTRGGFGSFGGFGFGGRSEDDLFSSFYSRANAARQSARRW